MALTGALCTTPFAATGITNTSLRALMTGLLGTPYSPVQMTYDLRRLRLGGVIRRIPRTNRYVLTDDGIRIAIFYTKTYNRLLRPPLAADRQQAPAELRDALKTISRHVNDYATRARLGPGPAKTRHKPPEVSNQGSLDGSAHVDGGAGHRTVAAGVPEGVDGPFGRLFLQTLAMVAEFEASLGRLRLREGMALAKRQGKQPELPESA